jgi:hypothetical protein
MLKIKGEIIFRVFLIYQFTNQVSKKNEVNKGMLMMSNKNEMSVTKMAGI